MKKNIFKIISMFAIAALLLADLPPVESDGTWMQRASTWFHDTVSALTPVRAADEPESYKLLFNNSRTYETGATIEYSGYSGSWSSIDLLLQGITVASGEALEWKINNENVATLTVDSSSTTSAKLAIKSPGYSALSVSLKKADGSYTSGIYYCSIYIPLEWDDTMNTKTTASDSGYGLFQAHSNDKDEMIYTLQMFTEGTQGHENQQYYLRRLKYIDYSCNGGTVTGAAFDAKGSYIRPEELDEPSTALTWSSSDSTVAYVDAKTGLITAVSAGFARITVTTDTSDTNAAPSTKTFNVVVVPASQIADYTTVDSMRYSVITATGDTDIVIQSNARFASSLNWQIFQGDSTADKYDITKEYIKYLDISDINGRVVAEGLPSGVYTITATPVKDSTALELSRAQYSVNGNTKSMRILLIVTMSLPDTNIILNYYNDDVSDQYEILENSNLPEGVFNFSSSNSEIASVDSNTGTISAEGIGECTVTVYPKNSQSLRKIYGTYTASAAAIMVSAGSITINVKVINGIALNTTTQTLPVGATYQLKLIAPSTVLEEDAKWTCSPKGIVEVDEYGLVTAVKAGTAYVYCRVKVSGVIKRAKCTFLVTSAVNGITLTSKYDYVSVGDNLTISANISPKVNGTKLIWYCSDESLASIEDASELSVTIKGVKPGQVVITAVNGDNCIVGTKVITVIQDITKITLSDTTVTIPQTAGFYQLYATCVPELPSTQVLDWQSTDTKVVKVDQNGKVTLVKPGTAVINVVTKNGLIASCTFTVTQGVKSIVFDDKEIELYVGESQRLTYKVTPSNATNVALKWEVHNSKIATVDQTGYVTAKNVGTTVIIAKSTDGTGVVEMITINVFRNATDLKLDVTSLQMELGETYTLGVTLTPADASDTVTFESSNAKIAAVSAVGKITAKAKGTATIIAKTETGIVRYCTVEVSVPVTGVKLSMSEAEIYVGDELELEAVIEPKNATDTDVVWSSRNTEVATVDDEGTVLGVSGGIVVIDCVTEDGDYMAYCVVTVIEHVASITVQETAEVGVGKKLKLTATIDNEKATNKNVTWKSSSKKICKVNEKGVITGVKVGTCIITVTAADGSGAYAECEVTVIHATEEITIDPNYTYIELIEGESKVVPFTMNPKNATYKPIWTSDNEASVIVSKNGQITGIKKGNAIVTAQAPDNPDVKAVTYVKVIEAVYATSVQFADSEVIMTAGEKKKVPYSIVPANVTESFTWSSDNPVVATVNEKTGEITANSVGAANITLMTRSGKKGTVKIFVVGLSETSVTLHQYEQLLLRLEIDGDGASNLTKRWGTKNQNIAVMNNGNVTAKALGTTTVYVMIGGRILECKIKVIKNE